MRNRFMSIMISVALVLHLLSAEVCADVVTVSGAAADETVMIEPELPTGGLKLPQGERIPDNLILSEDAPLLFAGQAGQKASLTGPDEVFVKGAGTYGRDSLSTKQQEYYDKLDKAATEFMTSGKDLTGSNDSYICSDGIDFSEMGLSQKDAVEAYVAFGYDHPAYYWLHGYSYTTKKIFFRTRALYKDAVVRKTIEQQIISAVKRYAKEMQKGQTDFEKVLILHNELAEAADYAYVEGTKEPVSENWAHTVIGIVDEDYSHVVCEGYAKMFSLLLNYMEIPNIYIVGNAGGGGHAWNAVSFDQGESYTYVDLTWDDANDWYYYMAMPKSDFEKMHSAYSSEGTGYQWLYDLPDTITDDLESSYYYRTGKYAGADTDIGGFLDAAKAEVLRFGRKLSVISDTENIRRQIGKELGNTSYYTISYQDKTYYCTNQSLRDTRYKSPVSDFGFEKDAEIVEMDFGKEEYRIKLATVTPKESDDYFFWKSSDPEVVSIENPHMPAGQGEVVQLSLLKDGSATLTATSSDAKISRSFRMTVIRIPVEGVSLTQTKLSLEEGETAKLVATLDPENASNRKVSWSSSRPSIAEVDDEGNVTAKATGKATVTVTTKDGNYTAACEVEVKPISVKGVSLTQTELVLEKEQAAGLVAVVTPANAANQEVLWKSADEKIATVDEKGTVTAVSVGKTVVTVRTQDGNYTADCSVTVTPVYVRGVSLTQTELTLEEGENSTLKAVITPANATEQKVYWTSGNDKIATVDESGNVTAVAVGSTTMTVRTEDGNYTADCSVTVKPVSVKGVSLDRTELTLEEGENGQLTAKIVPAKAANQKIHWTSSNEKSVTVSENGLVTAVSVGAATVTATTDDGNYTVDCRITVKPVSVRGVSVTPASLILEKGATGSLTVKISPANAAERKVLWSSGNDKIATVSENGLVTAVSAGTVVVRATTIDGGYTAECTVTVQPGQDDEQKEEDQKDVAQKENEQESGERRENEIQADASDLQPAAVGTVKTSASFVYQVTANASGVPQVSVRQPYDQKADRIVIPASVTVEGVTYQVTSIADNAFQGNKNVKSVVIPPTVTVIGKNAFSGCSSLRKITIPAGVKEIKANAFRGNKNLKKITVVSSVLKKVGKNALKGIHKKAVIKVPKKQKKAYQKLFRKKGQAGTVKVK